jgi:uncharacterized membrane protein
MWIYYIVGLVLGLTTIMSVPIVFGIPMVEDPERFIGATVGTLLFGYGAWWLLSHAEAIRIEGCEV